MHNATVRVVNQLGLHARAAAQLVKAAARFKSSIAINRIDGRAEADAKSMLSVLALAASRGTELEIVAVGLDSKDAIEAIVELFAAGFGEM